MRGLVSFAAATACLLASCSARTTANHPTTVLTSGNAVTPANAQSAAGDSDRYADYFAAAKVAAADFIIAHPTASDSEAAAIASAAARGAGDPDAVATGKDAVSDAREWVATRKANGFPPMTTAAELQANDGGGDDPDSPASSGVHFFPRVGSCFETQVASLGSRLEGVADSGSFVSYADGHSQTGYETSRTVLGFRVGDPVRLCVVALPSHCPPADDRGVVYEALDRRTDGHWKAADAEHMCGGA